VSVLTKGEQAVKMLGKDGKIAVRVMDAGVVVIRHSDGECDLDLRAHGSQCEAKDEGVVGVVVGAQEEASLGTAAGDHVVTAGHNLERDCHACDVGHGWKKLREKDPRMGCLILAIP
jgi:hypothetical protein